MIFMMLHNDTHDMLHTVHNECMYVIPPDNHIHDSHDMLHTVHT